MKKKKNIVKKVKKSERYTKVFALKVTPSMKKKIERLSRDGVDVPASVRLFLEEIVDG